MLEISNVRFLLLLTTFMVQTFKHTSLYPLKILFMNFNKILSTLLACLLALHVFAYDSVTDISTYEGDADFVFDITAQQWYALNNNGVYERYGVVESVSKLSVTTTYEGKYVRMGSAIYRFVQGRWISTDFAVSIVDTPADGVYIVDGGGHFVIPTEWDGFGVASGVAIVYGEKALMVAPRSLSVQHYALLAASSNTISLTSDLSTSTKIVDGMNGTFALTNTLGDKACSASTCKDYMFECGVTGYLPSVADVHFAMIEHGDALADALAVIEGEMFSDINQVSTSTLASPTMFWNVALQTGESSATDITSSCVAIPFASLPICAFDYPYTTSPYDSPTDADGIIHFSDDIAKDVCLRKYDYDHDGKISYAEAARVRDIDKDFAGMKMTSLDELAYFTSITNIYTESFQYCSEMTSITIPSGVRSISTFPFSNCPKLQTINIAPGNMRYSCVDGALFDYDRSTLIQVPQGKAGSFTIPSTTYYLFASSFEGCKRLTNIDISSEVGALGDGVFNSCTGLTSIKVHWSKPVEPSNAIFTGVTLSKVTLYVPKGTRSVYAASSVWGKFGNIVEYEDNTTETIPFSDNIVKAICVNFWDKDGDGELNLSEAAAVKSLNGAFRGKGDIILFPELAYFTGLTSIGEREFEGCTLLANIEIPQNVNSIGAYAFNNCSSLQSFFVPSLVRTIGKGAFDGTSSMLTISASSSSRYFSSIDNVLYNKASTKVIKCAQGNVYNVVRLPSTVTTIGEGAFREAKNTTVVIMPTALQTIEAHAFHGCSSLVSASLPASVTSIGEYAFADCPKLKSAVLNCKLSTIPVGMFAGCTSLLTLTLPSAPTAIGANAFADTPINALPKFDNPQSIGDYAFARCTQLRRVCLPNGITSLGSGAFLGCTNLVLTRIPSGVSTIGSFGYFVSDDSSTSALKRVLVDVETPPAITANCFADYENCTLYVPLESVSSYQADNEWGRFADIRPLLPGDVDLDGILNITDVINIVNRILNSSEEFDDDICPMQYDVNKDGTVNVSDAVQVVNVILGLQ